MRRLLIGFLCGLGLASPAWALTSEERTTVTDTARQLQSAAQDLDRWAQFVEEMEANAWVYSVTPIEGETITKSYDATAQKQVDQVYTDLKAKLTTLLSQLP